jgi:hypothetical protein
MIWLLVEDGPRYRRILDYGILDGWLELSPMRA